MNKSDTLKEEFWQRSDETIQNKAQREKKECKRKEDRMKMSNPFSGSLERRSKREWDRSNI